MSATQPRIRLEFLDGVRAIAALYVVLHHAYLTVYPHNDPVGAAAWAFSWLQYGSFGVAIFIVVSGYSLMIRPARVGGLGESYWSFIGRRFKRIILPYWIALAVSLILALTLLSRVTGTHWDVALPVTWQAVLVHLLGFQDVAYSAAINHVFWSVALEWHIYFVFPLLLWVWTRAGRVWPTVCLLAVTVGVAVVVGRLGVDIPVLEYLNFLGLFALGAWCCTLSRRDTGGREKWTLLAGALAAVALLELLVLRNWTLASSLVGLATGAAITAMARGTLQPLRAFLGSRPVVWVGTISYSLYLLHALVLQLVWQYVLTPMGFHLGQAPGVAALIPAGVALSLLVAWGFFFVAERPFLSSTHRARVEQEQASALRVAGGAAGLEPARPVVDEGDQARLR